MSPGCPRSAACRSPSLSNIHPIADTHPRLSLLGLAQWEKQIAGCIFGSVNSRADIPQLLGLDSMVTVTYPLEGINQGYRDLRDGRYIRGVLVM
jgi:Zn-dependent alcohol dehydrogenase